MPFVHVPRDWRDAGADWRDWRDWLGAETIEIYYETHGVGDEAGDGGGEGGDGARAAGSPRGRPARVLLLMGVAAASGGWGPQFPLFDGSGGARQCIAVDNRGIGRSASPERDSDYSTEFMARDAIAALTAAGWGAPGERIHIVGHSMGGMIACKVAALLGAERVASLMPISSSLGGGSAVPPLDFLFEAVGKTIRYSCLMPARAARARLDLWIHYSHDWLTHRVSHTDERLDGHHDGGAGGHGAGAGADGIERAPPAVSESRRLSLLRAEYIEVSANGGEQCKAGLNGQLRAVRTHRMSKRELRTIHEASYPILVVHGVNDQLATEAAGRALAHRLGKRATFVALSDPYPHMAHLGAVISIAPQGAHFCCRENAIEVNSLLMDLCRGGDGSCAGSRWRPPILQRADTLWHQPTYGCFVQWCCCGLGRPRSESAQVWRARTLRKVALASLFTATVASYTSERSKEIEGSDLDSDEHFEDASSDLPDEDLELGVTQLNPLVAADNFVDA